MGSTDLNVHIGIGVLGFEVRPDLDGVERYRIVSQFESYVAEHDAEVSWTGRDLSVEDGWCAYAHGTLFVRSDFHFSLFTPRRESRDDVEKLKSGSYSYFNGFHLGGPYVGGIYHLIFPTGHSLESVTYLSDPKNIKAVYPAVFHSRIVLTWLYGDSIQLKILFREALSHKEKLSRNQAFKVATKHLYPNPWVKRISEGVTLQSALEVLPKIMKVFGA